MPGSAGPILKWEMMKPTPVGNPLGNQIYVLFIGDSQLWFLALALRHHSKENSRPFLSFFPKGFNSEHISEPQKAFQPDPTLPRRWTWIHRVIVSGTRTDCGWLQHPKAIYPLQWLDSAMRMCLPHLHFYDSLNWFWRATQAESQREIQKTNSHDGPSAFIIINTEINYSEPLALKVCPNKYYWRSRLRDEGVNQHSGQKSDVDSQAQVHSAAACFSLSSNPTSRWKALLTLHVSSAE